MPLRHLPRPARVRTRVGVHARIQQMSVQQMQAHFGNRSIDELDKLHQELQVFVSRTEGIRSVEDAVLRFLG